jgi:hypothetical protein
MINNILLFFILISSSQFCIAGHLGEGGKTFYHIIHQANNILSVVEANNKDCECSADCYEDSFVSHVYDYYHKDNSSINKLDSIYNPDGHYDSGYYRHSFSNIYYPNIDKDLPQNDGKEREVKERNMPVASVDLPGSLLLCVFSVFICVLLFFHRRQKRIL